MCSLSPCTSRRSVVSESRYVRDRAWYTSESDWPTAADREGITDTWACVAADGRLRVFAEAVASSRTLLSSTPVLGPVLALALWPERRVVITLEEVSEPNSRCDRCIRFYSWTAGHREVLELAAVRLDQPPGSPVFSPSLFSLCTTERTLALAHDQEIRLYQLDDIFTQATNKENHASAVDDPPSSILRSLEDAEPGAEPRTPQPSPNRILTATFPNTRRYTVKVYQILPVATIYSHFPVRHLDYKQSYLSYSSYNESRLMCIRIEKAKPGRIGDLEREAVELARAMEEANLPTLQSLPAYQPIAAAARAARLNRTHSAAAPTPAPDQPFEILGTRAIDKKLRLVLRDDIYLREAILVLHRRAKPSEQIHTMRLIAPLAPRAPGNEAPKVVAHDGAAAQSATPARPRSGSPIQQALAAPSTPLPAIGASPFVRPVTAKQELFTMLGQGLPTGPISVPVSSHSSLADPQAQQPPMQGFVPARTFEHGGVVVELLDDDAEGLQSHTALQGLLARLEQLEDESEGDTVLKAPASAASPAPIQRGDSGSHASVEENSAIAEQARSNGSIYLPMRLLISSTDECHLYDVESDVRLVTYFYEHDLLALHVRSSFLLALTTHGLEVHSLWYRHPMLDYLTMPLQIAREEPILVRGQPLKVRLADMLVLNTAILLRPSPVQATPNGRDGVIGSPATQLIVPTDDMDPCESWSTWPLKEMPTVLNVVSTNVQPLAIKSMQSSTEATPSAIRLFTEALLLLIQRYSQLRALVNREAESPQATRSPAPFAPDDYRYSHSSACSPPAVSHELVSSQNLQKEFQGVSAALSAVNSYLAHLFLTARELGLSCYFFYYQQDAALPKLWEMLNKEVTKSLHSDAVLSTSRYVTKLLIKILLHPTARDRALLLSSPSLVASFLSHFSAHAPHILGALLLKSFLLQCPYDPKMVLRVLEEHAARGGNLMDGGGTNTTQSYRQSRTQSSAGTPTTSSASQMAATPYRVRPVVFHTFVQALMHLQLSATGSATTGSSGKDAASILLNSFSGHSLEHLLVTYSALLTTWSHRHLLVDFLRASTPWSLLEVLVVLTQRGEIHVEAGITLLLGANAAALVLSPSNLVKSPTSPLSQKETSPQQSLSPSLISSTIAATGNFGSMSALPLAQLQAYLECALNPFVLTQEIGNILEAQSTTIEPFDSPADRELYMRTADVPETGADAPADVDPSNSTAAFIPIHIRENHKHNPHHVVLAQPALGQTITREQVAALATQLACFYVQQELADQCAQMLSPPTSTRSSTSRSSASSTGALGTRRTASMSALAPAAEFSSRHTLGSWWKASWIDELRQQDGRGDAASLEPVSTRVKRLQALLSAPLPLGRAQCFRIFTLLQRLPNENLMTSAPVKASLMMLVLPRVGRLPDALRIVVGHSPECMWPFAQIYCGEESIKTLAASPTLHSPSSAPIHRHWQLLHAVLLMYILHSAHGAGVLQQFAPALLPAGHDDTATGRSVLQSLLPPALIDSLLKSLDSSISVETYSGVPSVNPPASPSNPDRAPPVTIVERANLYQQLYVFLLEQLVQRHSPSAFLSFIPPVGSSRFYLKFIEQNLESMIWRRTEAETPGDARRRDALA